MPIEIIRLTRFSPALARHEGFSSKSLYMKIFNKHQIGDRWSKAQRLEERSYRSRPRNESPDTWKKYLYELFAWDWAGFNSKTVLEVGSGGWGTIFFIQDAKYKAAVEPLGQKYQDVYSQRHDNTEIFSIPGEHLPFADDTFDIVMCLNVIDHAINPTTILTEIHRVMKPTGILLFSVNTFVSPRILRILLDRIDKPHLHHFCENDINRLLSDTHLTILSSSRKADGVSYFFDRIRKRLVVPSLLALASVALRARLLAFTCTKG